MVNTLRIQNATIEEENQESFSLNNDMKFSYINDALCTISRNIFFDQQINYCSNNDADADKFSKKM